MKTKGLKETRKEKNLSQDDLAELAGISQVALSNIETGKAIPRDETRRKIEQALGQRINWLKTKGLRSVKQGKLSSWEAVEQMFREALIEINSLQTNERKEFIQLAKQYIKSFEQDLNA